MEVPERKSNLGVKTTMWKVSSSLESVEAVTELVRNITEEIHVLECVRQNMNTKHFIEYILYIQHFAGY